MASGQINDRTRAFVDENGLRDRVLFLADEDSAVIRELGILRPNAEPMEKGVPHPTTFIVDREGIVRFADVREDFHIWLAPEVILEQLAGIP
jgi:peroxiredoxin